MSPRRVGLSAITVLFSVALTSAASAGGCGCWWQQAYYLQPALYVVDPYRAPSALAPSPIYVVRQGPYYSGPGLMVPYQTWSPSVQVGAYPYIGPRRYGGVRYYGYPRRAYRYQGYYQEPMVYPRRSAVRYPGRYRGPAVAPMPRRAVVRADRTRGTVVLPPTRGRVQGTAPRRMDGPPPQDKK
jgi:hypothetical protein